MRETSWGRPGMRTRVAEPADTVPSTDQSPVPVCALHRPEPCPSLCSKGPSRGCSSSRVFYLMDILSLCSCPFYNMWTQCPRIHCEAEAVFCCMDLICSPGLDDFVWVTSSREKLQNVFSDKMNVTDRHRHVGRMG
ncbi:unnamed protein product [Pleuronectes platessa]|uniref:Uncharacterized protein n=1 Tax=Pleuronectes platessa TaxID=8262 RepID=A0A9N7Y9F9_PLEPL|nr:unnamed protein product [Pleuronectes platessa]